jgi:hypothetical protein
MTASAGLGLATLGNLYLVGRAVMAARARAPTPMIDGMAHLGGTAVGAAWWAKRAAEEARGGHGAPPRRGGWGVAV